MRRGREHPVTHALAMLYSPPPLNRGGLPLRGPPDRAWRCHAIQPPYVTLSVLRNWQAADKVTQVRSKSMDQTSEEKPKWEHGGHVRGTKLYRESDAAGERGRALNSGGRASGQDQRPGTEEDQTKKPRQGATVQAKL